MTLPLLDLVGALARRRGIRLAPDWQSAVAIDLALDDAEAPWRLSELAGWDAPVSVDTRPGPQDFPMLVYVNQLGWAMAEQWQGPDHIRAITASGLAEVEWAPGLRLVQMSFPDAAGAENHLSAFAVFRAAILGRRRMIVDATAATVVINVLALITSIYSMQVYDRVIPRASYDTLWVLTVGMAFALLVDFLIRNTRAFLIDEEASGIDAEVSEYFFARMQSVRLDARPPGVGTMAAQLRGLEQVRAVMASASLFILADLPFALLFMVVMYGIGGSVVIVPALTFPLAIGAAMLFSRMIREDAHKSQVSGNRKNGLLVEALGAAETVKANLGGWHMLAGWNRLVDTVHRHDNRVRRWSTLSGSTFNVLQQVAYVGIIVLGVYEVADHRLTMGGLIACTIISGRINGPLVAALPNLIVQWSYARSSLQALDSILRLPSDHPHDRQMLRMGPVQAGMRLANVQFAYPGARSGVEIPGLFINRGEKVGIIGSVGSGKSTLLKVMAGLYAPAVGQVTLDGVEISQIAEDDLRRQLIYLPQSFDLLSGSLRDNLGLGIANPNDERLLAAAQRTGLAELLRQHPMGLDLPISEGGFGLSGGQRALVGLTRLLLTDPSILLLDEPTANLDPETELRALQQIFGHFAGKTVVMVTHKPQLLSFVDRVLVVIDGRLALDGKTADVLNQLRPKPAPNPAREVPGQSHPQDKE
ncbi:ATP-binding cassette subfamily C protein LapB [Novosphingobium sp. SG751A]|uniref:ATP-binding cassette domain-containing protein n=1 Tax=Novosphingobium sp. SG751A TaxID=2587000 RepID=UPI001555E16D|nr:ATP-binding cassette subfamily C protein LapB [Novosphingobium sp. SG751A]